MSSPHPSSGTGGTPDTTAQLPTVSEDAGGPAGDEYPRTHDSGGTAAVDSESTASEAVDGPGGGTVHDESGAAFSRGGDYPVDEQDAPARDGRPDGAPEQSGDAAAVGASGGSAERPAARRPRRARLVLRRIDPWSVARMTLVISLALLVVFLVAVAVLYLVLDLLGVFETLNDTVRDLTSSDEEGAAGGLEIVFSAGRILGASALLGSIYVLLATALATLGALLYNVCADLAGGIEVTLTESS